MRIELSLTAAQIIFLAAVLDSFVKNNKEGLFKMSRTEKAVYSISEGLADKFYTKGKTAQRKKDKNKPSQVTLKYHEAHAINYFVFKIKDDDRDLYVKSLATNIYMQLDPELG